MKGLLAPATTIGINMCCCCLNSVRGVVWCYNSKYAEGTWEQCCVMSSTSPSPLAAWVSNEKNWLQPQQSGGSVGYSTDHEPKHPWLCNVPVLSINRFLSLLFLTERHLAQIGSPRETDHDRFRSYLGGTDSSVTAICSAIICTRINTCLLSGSDIWIQFACMKIWPFCHISQRCSLC